MRILVLGATGSVGILLIREALRKYRGCTIVAYARSPKNLPSDLAAESALVVIQGELDDRDELSKAMEGVHVVLSALGPSVMKGPFHPSGTPLAKAYALVIELMREHGVKRLICLGTASISDPEDKFSLAFTTLVLGVGTFARTAYNDVVAIGDNVRNLGADLDWTIVRVPILTDRETKDVIAGYVGDGKTGAFLARAGFASFVIDEIEKRAWIKKAPLISSP